MMSTISSGSVSIFFLLRLMVRPGLSPLASAALASFSRAARMASRARARTWLPEMGWPAERFEADGTSRRLGTGGGGVGFARAAAAIARRACAGLSGSPRVKSIGAIGLQSVPSRATSGFSSQRCGGRSEGTRIGDIVAAFSRDSNAEGPEFFSFLFFFLLFLDRRARWWQAGERGHGETNHLRSGQGSGREGGPGNLGGEGRKKESGRPATGELGSQRTARRRWGPKHGWCRRCRAEGQQSRTRSVWTATPPSRVHVR